MLVFAVILGTAGCPGAPKDILSPVPDPMSLAPVNIVACKTSAVVVIDDPVQRACCACMSPAGSVLVGAIEAAGLPTPTEFARRVVKVAAESVGAQLPSWPLITTIDTAVSDLRSFRGTTVVEVRVNQLMFGAYYGLKSATTVRILDRTGVRIWQRSYTYVSKAAGRTLSLEEYRKNSNLPSKRAEAIGAVRSEMEFAAEATAHDLVEHLR